MEFETPQFKGRPPIDSYGDGGFTLGGGFRRGSLLLLAERMDAWSPTRLEDASTETLTAVIDDAAAYDFLLIGTGAQIARPPAALSEALNVAGLPMDFMDTGAACRTYNVLLAEQRRFAAALIAVE
ncbi:MAG: MTH938/NDUFAF3 family protein [Pseudomonadota bacterium]